MNRIYINLGLSGLLLAVSACDTDSSNWTGGIEGSGITNGASISSAGAVTALGSIFVNGVEFDLTGATITLDGRLVGENDLDVGSIVVVEGSLDPGGLTGRAIRVTAGTAVAGPIESVTIEHDGFIVLGQLVHIDSATVVEPGVEGQPLNGLTVGRDVEISGFIDSYGTIRARRVIPRPVGRPLLLTGYVEALDPVNQVFTLNGVSVDFSSATLADFVLAISDGDFVRVTAAAVNGDASISADEVAYRDLRMPGAAGDTAILQGWVTRYVSPSEFDIDGRRVVGTTHRADLSLDDFVSVSGKVTQDGAVDLEALLIGGPPKVRVTDVAGNAIVGALVTITTANTQYQATTDADGIATFASFPGGAGVFTISAPGFDTETFSGGLGYGEHYGLTLNAEDAWAIGRPIVLAARSVNRATDGSALVFSLDIAVIDDASEPIQTLTSADFSIGGFDCGWGGSRDCASDANGDATGNFTGGHPSQFAGIQAGAPRVPYLVEIIAVRSDREYWRTNRPYWETMAPALKSFVSQVGGVDSIALSTIQMEGEMTTRTLLGPFTNDGSIYFDAIDQLGLAAGHDWPSILEGVTEAIQRTAAVRDAAPYETNAAVLVLGQPWLSIDEVNAITSLARQLDVAVSTVEYWVTYGIPEVVTRTGGIAAYVDDTRQFPAVFNAMDRALAEAVPFYRMEFELTAAPGTFVSGGNAKVRIHIAPPAGVLARPIEALADVEIP